MAAVDQGLQRLPHGCTRTRSEVDAVTRHRRDLVAHHLPGIVIQKNLVDAIAAWLIGHDAVSDDDVPVILALANASGDQPSQVLGVPTTADAATIRWRCRPTGPACRACAHSNEAPDGWSIVTTLGVYDELEFGRLFDRDVRGLGAIQDFDDLRGARRPRSVVIFPVSDQTARFAPAEPLGASGRQTIAHGHRHNLGAPREQRRVGRHEKRRLAATGQRGDFGLQLVEAIHAQIDQLEAGLGALAAETLPSASRDTLATCLVPKEFGA